MAFRFRGVIRFITIGLTFLAAEWRGRAEDWPCWRGPRHDGITRETGLLTAWPKDGPRQLWKAELSGGFSAVVVAVSHTTSAPTRSPCVPVRLATKALSTASMSRNACSTSVGYTVAPLTLNMSSDRPW